MPSSSRAESLPKVEKRTHEAKENVDSVTKYFANFHEASKMLLHNLESSVLGVSSQFNVNK